MKAAQTLIAWNGKDYKSRQAPAGSIALGLLQDEDVDKLDWTNPYECTGGAAYVSRRKLRGVPQRLCVMLDWYMLVYDYGIHPYLAHRAFLLIDEYQAVIKAMGFGPAEGEPGHDPGVGYGRAISTPVPKLKVNTLGRSTHFWPEVQP